MYISDRIIILDLKQIHDVEQQKPKKRKRNVLNSLQLRDIFSEAIQYKQFKTESVIERAPEDYDPYHRIRKLQLEYMKDKTQTEQVQEKPKHRIHTIQQRSDILGSQKLASKFRSASGTNSFVQGNLAKVEQLKRFFHDQQKNRRYIDYVDELKGRRIVERNQFMSFQQIEKEKEEFQNMYKKQKEESLKTKVMKLPIQIQQALSQNKNNDKSKIKVVRSVKAWKPERLLCSRFGFLVPYKIQQGRQKKQQYY